MHLLNTIWWQCRKGKRLLDSINLFFKGIFRGILNLFLDSRNLQLNIYLEKSRNLKQYCLELVHCAVKIPINVKLFFYIHFVRVFFMFNYFSWKGRFLRDSDFNLNVLNGKVQYTLENLQAREMLSEPETKKLVLIMKWMHKNVFSSKYAVHRAALSTNTGRMLPSQISFPPFIALLFL